MYAVLVDAESVRSKRERPSNPDAFDLIIRARSIALNAMSQLEHAERIRLYEEALRLGSTSVIAMTELAQELTRLTSIFSLGYEFDRAARLIESAAAIEPNHLLVMDVSAYILYHQDRFDEAIFAYQRLLKHFPYWHTAYNQIGFCLVFTGRAQEAVSLIKFAIEREPRSGFSWSRYENMGFALLMAGNAEELMLWTQRALAANPCNLPFFALNSICDLPLLTCILGNSTRLAVGLPRRTGFGRMILFEVIGLAIRPVACIRLRSSASNRHCAMRGIETMQRRTLISVCHRTRSFTANRQG